MNLQVILPLDTTPRGWDELFDPKYPSNGSRKKLPYEVDEKLAMVLAREAIEVYNIDEIFMYAKRLLKVNTKKQIL